MTKMFISLKVKYLLLLSDFNETLIFSLEFRKILKYQISLKSLQRGPIYSTQTDRQTDGRTGMTKLTVAFRNFAMKDLNGLGYGALYSEDRACLLCRSQTRSLLQGC